MEPNPMEALAREWFKAMCLPHVESDERNLTALLDRVRREAVEQTARDVNDFCEAISRIRWARGTDKLDAAIFEAVRVQSIIDASHSHSALEASDAGK